MLKPLRIKINKNCSFLMIPVEGGAFHMGDEVGDLWEACRPVHPVQVSSFYLAQFPVTQKLWEVVMEKKWEYLQFSGDDRPIERISWDDTQLFLKTLEKKTNRRFRLPTEAEWEFAARGGINSFPLVEDRERPSGRIFAGSTRLKEVGWFIKNSHGETKSVGRLFPNELGLYDMSGNVEEWCEDHWHPDYNGAPEDGSAWVNAEGDSDRVFRGGSWDNSPRHCFSSCRIYNHSAGRNFFCGFRLALSLQSAGPPSRAGL